VSRSSRVSSATFLLLAALSLPFSPTPAGWSRAGAQEAAVVDRIAAVVGDSVIVLSQVRESMLRLAYRLEAQGQELPPEGSPEWDRLQREILDDMVGQQLIIQAAARDSLIMVDDVDVENIVSQEMDRIISDMGGQERFEAGLAQEGLTLSGYRDYLRGQIRQQQLQQQYMAKRSAELSSVVVEESEIEAFFEAQREAIGQRPPTVVFAQIILDPTPSDSVWEATRERAEEIYEMAVAGEDFGELARRFSDDASKDGGGDLGWFRRGDMLPAFEEAAFRMVVDEISRPVRSEVGYHVIKVTRRRSGEIRASHILLLVRPGEGDVAATRQLAEELRTRLQAGEDLAPLREQYGDTEEPDTLRVPMAQLRDLPPGFAEPLAQADPGEVLEPIEYEVRGVPRISVVEVQDVLPAGPYTLDDADLRTRITQTLQQEKLMEKIMDELRASTYVEILL